MRKILIAAATAMALSGTQAQNVTLDSCYAWARENHPLLKQSGVTDELSALRQKSIGASDLPQIDLTGRATYQSDVTKLSLPIPGIKVSGMSKDQYKLYVEVKQKLYDFGMAKNRRAVEEADRRVNVQQNETELHKIRETVTGLYFQILAHQENERILRLKKEMLSERIGVIASSVKHGVALQNELDNLKAERLTAEQQIVETESGKKTALDLLVLITGRESLYRSGSFGLPALQPDAASGYNRPELKLLDLQKNKMEKSSALLSSSRLPGLFAFGQTGYGRPGLNMLNNDFDTWYLVGVGLSWNLWDGNKTKHDRAALKKQMNLIDLQRDNLVRNLNMAATQEENNYRKMKELMSRDVEIVALKEGIAKRTASALDNGTATSADYIRDLNASLQSKALLELHKIQGAMALANLNVIKN